MSPWRRLAGVLAVAWLPCAQAAVCGSDGVWIQVLGSIEPGADGRPLSSSFLVWLDGKARVLVDTGNGSAGNFYGNGARLADLDVILLTYLHVDHTADLPTLIQASLPEKRARALPIYGPARSKLAPSTVTFVRTLFDNKRGLYRYLGAFLSPLGRETYKLQPHDVRIKRRYVPDVYRNERVRVSAAAAVRDPVLALAWRLQTRGKFIVFVSNVSNNSDGLDQMGRGADLLVVHSPVRNDMTRSLRTYHMSLATIAQLASDIGAKKLALTHRVRARDDEQTVGKTYSGAIVVAGEGDCFSP